MPDNDDRTRDRLLQAAIELLKERGFSTVTTRAVSQRAGVNNALVHYYFGTKAALLVEAALASLGADLDTPTRLMAEATSLASGIAAVIQWIATLDVSDPNVRLLVDLTVEGLRNPEVQPVVADALTGGRADLTAALSARPDVGAAAAPPLAGLLVALFDGLMLHRLIDRELDVAPWAAAGAAVAAAVVPGSTTTSRRSPS